MAATLLVVAGEHSATGVSPVAVPFASGPAFPLHRDNAAVPDPQYGAEQAIDGDVDTFACLLDDTLDGNGSNTIPPRAVAPVTGHMIFDLGKSMVVAGVRLTGRRDAGGMNPKNVDFFYFADDDPSNNAVVDDIENDPDINSLVAGHACKSLAPGAFENVTWNGVVARYIGMRVNGSFESGDTHFNFQIGEIEFAAIPASPTLRSGSRVPSFYLKKSTLPETMLASRARYTVWFPRRGRAGRCG